MSAVPLLRAVSQPVNRIRLPGWRGYVFAVGMVALALLVRWALPEALGSRVPFPTLFLAVFASAWVGGLGPGLLASALTIASGVVVFPISDAPLDWRDAVALGFVFSVCAAGTYACARLRVSIDVVANDRAWYERILDRVGDAVLVVDAGGVLRFFNPEAARLWGLDARSLGRAVDEVTALWGQDLGPRVDGFMERMRRDGNDATLPAGLEVRIGQRAIAVVGNVSPFHDPQYGEAAVISVQSVQALREAARQVEATERRMHALFDSDVVGLFSIDLEGRISSINGAMLRLLGYPTDAAGPRRVQDIAGASPSPLWRVLRRRGGVCAPFDCTLRTLDGGTRWVSLGIVAIASHERMVFVTDIDARKQAERDHIEAKGLLQTLIDQVPAFVAFISPDGRIAVANRSYREFMRAREGDHWRRGMPRGVLPHLREPGFGKRGAPRAFTVQVRDRAGALMELQVRLVPYRPLGSARAGIVVHAYDITDRLARERALARSETRFRQLAEASAAVVWRADQSGRVLTAIGWTAFVGTSEPASIDDWLALAHPDDVGHAQAFIDAMREQRCSCEAEFRMRVAAGEDRYVSIRAVILDGLGEGTFEWIGTIRDIHQRRMAEQALSSKEHQLRLILNAVPARIAYFDPDDRLQWANGRFVEWFGVSGDGAGRPLGEVLPDGVMASLAGPLASAREGVISQVEWMENHPVHGIRWTTTTLSPDMDEHGRVRGVISLCMDSTLRHEAEDALRRSDAEHRTLAESVPHMVWMADPDGALQYVNVRWAEYTGQDASGTFTLPMHPGDRVAAMAAFREASGTGSELAIEVRFCRASDGAFRWHLVRAMPLLDIDGHILRWYGTCTDIEDQKAAQESLREAHSRTNHFLATLSHELRNPLAALMASVEALEPALSEEGRRQALTAAIQRQAGHLKRLTDDLLDVTRITLGRIRMTMEVVDINALCRDACSDMSRKASRSRVNVDCHLADAPVTVLGDPTRLRQCIDNLVSNAIKASRAGQSVHVTCRATERFAEVIVRDEGVGIEEDARASLFLPFAQSREWEHRGLGLGLSIVSKLVELHNGSVWVDSKGRHRGATFGIRVPLTRVERNAPPGKRAERPGLYTGIVLIVDDETDNALALQFLLALDGHDVHVAVDGASALQIAEAVRPQVVICDLGLPHPLDGYAVAAQLRARHGTTMHLCAYSGFGSESDIARALGAGFDAHLTKPSTPRELRDEVQRGLERLSEDVAPIG